MTVLTIIALLLVANGLYVAAEFALLGSSRQKIARLAADGNSRAKRVNEILNNANLQDHYIATAQLGITLASLGLGMYGEHALAHWLIAFFDRIDISAVIAAHTAASVVSIAALTYLHIVLGEMIPKSIALQNASRAVLLLYWPMVVSARAFAPFVILLNRAGSGLLWLVGIRETAPHTQLPSKEEVRFIVSESQEKGLLSADAGSILQELLEFAELTAYHVMVPRISVQAIPADAEPEVIKNLVQRSTHSRYPVFDGTIDNIIGQIHIKDLLDLMLEDKPLSRDLARPVPFLPETASLETVLSTMRRERSQLVIVLDEHGGTAGMLATEDLFEEVIGPLEEDPDVTMARGIDELLRVPGTFRLSELEEEFNISLEHEEVETVSGLVLSELDRPPVVGDKISYRGIVIEVTKVRGRGVAQCTVRKEETLETEEN